MAGAVKRVYVFGRFRLDVNERMLLRDGSPLPLTPKLFDTLVLLVENSGHLLSKDELMKKLWPDSFVEEINLTQYVSRLRKLLEEKPNDRFIATIPGLGYRFVAEVCEASDNKNGADGLVIESHTRETVVVEEDDDDQESGKLVVTPALPAGRNFRRAYWLIPLALVLATLVWFALPPKPPRLLASTQITNDGRLKWTKWQQGYQGPLLFTDGSRIYTAEDKGLSSFQRTLVQVPASGGETVAISVPFPRFQVTDMDRHRSELLLLNWQGIPVAPEGPLWAYSVVNSSYRRVGDLRVSGATWASDGRILFTRTDGLWSADSDGSKEHLLVKLPGLLHAPRESPDRRRVIRFTLADPQTGSSSLWEVSHDGKNPHPLLQGWNNSPRECCGSWTPDGRYYIFQSLRDGRYGIWALRERGGLLGKSRGPFQLTTGPIDYVAPMISPDGKHLFCSRNAIEKRIAAF